MNGHVRLEPDAADFMAPRLPGIDFNFTASHRAICILRANGSALDGHGKDSPAAPEQPPESVHRREEIAAIRPHHREQQIATGVSCQPVVLLQHRQT